MALNQKYTWHDFLKEHPEMREKKIKRNSNEAKKAFDSAFKKHIAGYLNTRIEKMDRLIARSTEKRNTLQTTAKETRQAGRKERVKELDKQIAKTDIAIARHNRQQQRNNNLAKEFK